jgi:hypothetical protein
MELKVEIENSSSHFKVLNLYSCLGGNRFILRLSIIKLYLHYEKMVKKIYRMQKL